MSNNKFQIGDLCNWVNQRERLIYLGLGTGASRGWHQFALVERPHAVWCEVLTEDLESIERTKEQQT